MPQNLDLTKRSRTTEAEILGAFRDRLREACEGLNDMTCFISDQPIPVMIPAGGGHCVTVSTGNGSFDQSMFAGGGHETLNEDSQIVITPMVKIRLDRVPHAEKALLSNDRGIVSRWKRNILRCILLADPDLGHDSLPWEPAVNDTPENTEAALRPLLRDQVRPVSCTSPADIPGHDGWIGIHMTFAISFDWDLSNA